MNRIVNYILCAVIIIQLTLLGVQGCQRLNIKKQLTQAEQKYSILQAQWWKLINTPPRITHLVTQVEVQNNHPVIPTPLPDEGTNQPPALSTEGTGGSESDSCGPKRYAETYHIGDSIHISWKARTKGYIKEFDILSVKYPSRTTIIERFIPCPQIDTANIINQSKKRWHYGGSIGLWGQNLKVFPGIQAGGFFGWSDHWIINPAALYNLQDGHLYWNLNLLLYIK